MTWKKGESGNPSGRPKGSKGKIGLDFVLAMQDSFHKLGGVKWLCRFADKNDENRRAFMSTMARFIPAQTMQLMLMEDVRKTESKSLRIEYTSVPEEVYFKRLEQLETLIKESKLKLPPADEDFKHLLTRRKADRPMELPELRAEKPQETSSLPSSSKVKLVLTDHKEEDSEKASDEDPFRAIAQRNANKRAKEREEKKARERSRGDDDSWVTTVKDD